MQISSRSHRKSTVFRFLIDVTIIIILAAIPAPALAPVSEVYAQGAATRGGTVTVEPNLLSGLTASFDPAPNYSLCTDEDDAKQLTDGVMHKAYNSVIDGADIDSMWARKGTVGWNHANPLTIRFDLGKSANIGSIGVNVAAGASGVFWPRVIAILVSDDDKSWRYAGDVVSLSRANGLPPIQDYTIHRFVTADLNEKARYVAFVTLVSGTVFFFTDEITIAPSANATASPETRGPVFADFAAARQYVTDNATRFGISERLNRDYNAIRSELDASTLSASRKQELRGRLDSALAQSASFEVPPAADFKTILPLSPSHREMLAVHGEVLGSRGLPAHFVRKNHRYEYVDWLKVPEITTPTNAAPAKASGNAVSMTLLDGERGTDAFWIGNASDKAQAVRIRINTPRGVQRDWIRVLLVPWNDTAQNVPVAAAMLPLAANDYVYNIDLAAGMTSKVWLEVDSSRVPPGRYNTSIVVAGGGPTIRMPFNIRVLREEMPRPRLGLSLWDYTDRDGLYGVTARNLASSISLMRHYGVDAPWASPSTVPTPTPEHFDSNNKLVRPLDFTLFDQWVARWPGARRYCLFANWHEPVFAGARLGTPEFEARVGNWARAMSQHMRDLNLKPEQLVLLTLDEPWNNDHDVIVAGLLRALQKAAPELTCFNDPTWRDPNQSQHQDAFNLADILCPNVQTWMGNKEVSEKYYGEKVAKGKALWFYECSAPARTTDPTAYFRLPAMLAFRTGGSAVNYWSFGDSGGAVNSWNEYTCRGQSYTPAYLGNDDAVASIHFAAIYDGLQDYEVLCLLREAVKRTRNKEVKQAAERLLSAKSLQAISDIPEDYRWTGSSGHERIDAFRAQAIELLEKASRK